MFLKYSVLWPRRWVENYSISDLSFHIKLQLEDVVMCGEDINGCSVSVGDDQATLSIADERLHWSFELINAIHPEPLIMVNGGHLTTIQEALYTQWWAFNVYIPHRQEEEEEEEEEEDDLEDQNLECLYEMLDDSSIDLSDAETVILSDLDALSDCD
ncbi:uncharacterized protein LOC141532848 [Cotesia typhae]|uniref:uncharacterized protein LOC141532848 n=1 Tax=Cotesia typhae TaxID=2053667 RepID=UPI003D6812BF